MRGGGARRAPALLWVGALLGIGLAVFGVLRPAPQDAPEISGPVALVNGHAISREAFERLLERARADSEPLDEAAEKRRLLERLVDEELLLGHGLELDLVHVDPEVRAALLRSVVGAIQGAAEIEEPTTDQLREFHRAHPDRFRAPPGVDLEILGVPIDGRSESAAYRLAAGLARRLREGERVERLRAGLEDGVAPPLPPGPVAMELLAERLGGSAARAVAGLVPGEVADPVRGSDGWWVIRLRGRAPAGVLPFEEVRDRVGSEWRRERGEAAVREYLEQARETAEIRILDPALAP